MKKDISQITDFRPAFHPCIRIWPGCFEVSRFPMYSRYSTRCFCPGKAALLFLEMVVMPSDFAVQMVHLRAERGRQYNCVKVHP